MSMEHGFEERGQPRKFNRRTALKIGSVGIVGGVIFSDTGLEGLGFGQSSETHSTNPDSPSTPADEPRQGFPDEEQNEKNEDSKGAIPYISGE